jgi:hypothetical protein
VFGIPVIATELVGKSDADAAIFPGVGEREEFLAGTTGGRTTAEILSRKKTELVDNKGSS